MTAINLALAGPSISREQKSALVDRITDAFSQVEVGNDSPMIRAGFSIKFEHIEDDDLWIGTQPAVSASPSNRAAIVTVRVMAGPWTNAMKAELFERVETILRETIDMPKEGSGADFWMTILEVPEGGWGLGGRTVSIGAIAPVFKTEQQDRIKKYLETAREKE